MKWFLYIAIVWAVISFILALTSLGRKKINIKINCRTVYPNFWGKWLTLYLVPLLIIFILIFLVPILFSIAGMILAIIFLIIFFIILTAIVIYIFRLFI